MMPEKSVKYISIMGSTGSIGTQTLDIVRAHGDKFEVTALTACRNWELLARQALEFNPKMVVIADETNLASLKEALSGTDIEVAGGHQQLDRAASHPLTNVTVCGLVGYSGLDSTIAAIKGKKTIALANKETLVVAGEIICRLAEENGTEILPVDSEHSAIFQCLQGEDRDSIEKLILTASGGPFRRMSAEDMEKVSVRDALSHPNWDMGAKVTIDSATMMNKGFEMMEASWLFGCSPDKIEAVVHPQSIVHSMVEFTDGSVKAQLGLPDMHTPIRYALSYPKRLEEPACAGMKISDYRELTFETPDLKRFPLLALAYEVAKTGGNAPAVLNAANEEAVKAFIDGKIKFTDIYRVVKTTLEGYTLTTDLSLEIIQATHSEATEKSKEIISKISR